MTPNDILAIAREGNPKVIAAILNRSTRSHGLSVRVARHDRQLHVLIEGAPAMNQASMVSFIRLSLKKLKIDAIETVKIYGRQMGQKSVAWSQEIALRPSQQSVMSTIPPASPVTQSSESAFPQPLSLNSPSPEDSPIHSPPADPPEEPPIDASPAEKSAASPEAAQVNEAPAEAAEAKEAQFSPPEVTAPSAPPVPAPEAAASPQTELAPDDAAPSTVISDSLVAEDQGTFEHPDFPGDEIGQEAVDETAAIAQPTSTAPAETPETEEEAVEFNFRSLRDRPEAVVLVLFLLALYIWQLYESLMAEVAPAGSLSGRALAARLEVSYSAISRRKEMTDFPTWSQSLDPDGIAWFYVDRAFVPNLMGEPQ
ncbi:MAG: hypothetical protein ACFB8W_04060 [Elainellaceae cyanobacterium]